MSTRLRRTLGRPALHALAAALAFAAFLAPLLVSASPSVTLLFMYGVWAASVPLLFALTRGDSSDEDEP
jgi:hypothetical protein